MQVLKDQKLVISANGGMITKLVWQMPGYVEATTPNNYTKALDALISFEITSAGEHTLEMKYAPKTFTLGLAISILSLMLFVAIVIFEKPLLIIRDKLFAKSTAEEERVDDNNNDDVEAESPNEQVEE